MNRKPPMPICKSFLVCRKIDGDNLTLLGKAKCFVNRHYPNGLPLAFFMRLTGGHGDYGIEVQLQNKSGDVLWRDGPPKPWSPESPLHTLELSLRCTLIFPGPGDYSLVLTANGEELDREPIAARLLAPAVNQ